MVRNLSAVQQRNQNKQQDTLVCPSWHIMGFAGARHFFCNKGLDLKKA